MPNDIRPKTRPWSADEDSAIVADYFAALDELKAGRPVNKAATRRALALKLANRAEGSIEFKRCNVSACLRDNGFTWWPGYLPCDNYARGIAAAVAAELERRNAKPATAAA